MNNTWLFILQALTIIVVVVENGEAEHILEVRGRRILQGHGSPSYGPAGRDRCPAAERPANILDSNSRP